MMTRLLQSALVGLLQAAALRLLAGPVPVAEWHFDRPGELQGWQPNSHIADVASANGALSFRTVGPDPILEYRPLLDIKASPGQAVEVRLKADRDGVAELFWSNTSTGRYGGFTQEKTTRFNVHGDTQWHTYRLLPSWQAEGKIVRLRFDVYDAAKFDLAYLRIVEFASEPAVDLTQTRDFGGWQWFEPADDREIALVSDPQALVCGTGLLLSPLVNIDASKNSFVSLRMAVGHGRRGTLFYATDTKNGLHSRSFSIEPDGREHIYNLDMLETSDWGGRVVTLALQPNEDTNAVARLRSIKISDAPDGPPQLHLVSFGLAEALPKAGLSAELVAEVTNTGAETASNVQASVKLPPGLELKTRSAAQRPVNLRFGEATTFQWKVQTDAPLEGEAKLTLTAVNAEPATGAARVAFTRRIPVKANLPPPKPIRGPYEVGAYYFPGWKTASQWRPLKSFPERKPVLGWYQEGDPEVADWHIRWAVEHGITFFAYDWYWSQGARQLEHALHDGLFKARYRHLLKFCLLWANHNPPKSSSLADCIAVTRYWSETYFQRPEHLRFEGKPVVIVFAPDRLTEDLGSQGVKQALEAMRAECQKEGLRGLYLIACIGDAGGARRAAEEGYDSITAYNWPGLGMTGDTVFAPYETLVEGYRRHWEHLLQESRVPLFPLPVCGGWDSRPWHGENNLVRFGRTPELFKRHLVDARRILESPHLKQGAPRAVLIEAWNEWGEGSYIEPHAEFGFGYLDAIREVFTDARTAHDDIAPADAGLGPYDVPPAEPARTAWDFSRADQAWNNTMQLGDIKTAQGFLSARSTGHDPAFFGPPIQAQAANYSAVLLRMRLTRANGSPMQDTAQLFWATSRIRESESTSARFPVQVDGEWHEYRVPVALNPRWRGTITRLRLDPVNQPDIKVDLERLRLDTTPGDAGRP